MGVSLGLVAVLLVITFMVDRAPHLGLDLQGGVSVALKPVTKGGKVDSSVTDESLAQAADIIRRRVDGLGIAEPDVHPEGNTILIQIPGAKDQEEVLEVVGSTAQLEFRPVLAPVGEILKGDARKEAEKQLKELRTKLDIPDGVTAAQVFEDEQANTPAPEVDDATDPDATDDTTATSTPTTTPATEEEPKGPFNQWGVDVTSEDFGTVYGLESQLNAELTAPEDMVDDQEVVLATEEGAIYRLGPMMLDGRAVAKATAGLNEVGQWQVNPVFHKGKNGIDKFNAAAATCYSGAPECPDLGGGRGQLAIVLDGEILSAPTINNATFSADQISISGSFDKEGAERLAVSLRYGSLPIQLEPQQAQTVSPTLGKGALQAGLLSGLVGLIVVLVYLMLYYRLLGIVTAVGTAMLGGMLWLIMSWLGATVTLAGVVGIVVSIGTSVDSNIIFFEVLKEDVLKGMPFRTAADKSFNSAWKTILSSDAASLIGAGVLYMLAIGPVKGFAFYLGAVTILDLIVVYFILRPAVYWIAHSEWGHNPRLFGIPVSYDDDRHVEDGRRRGRRNGRSGKDAGPIVGGPLGDEGGTEAADDDSMSLAGKGDE